MAGPKIALQCALELKSPTRIVLLWTEIDRLFFITLAPLLPQLLGVGCPEALPKEVTPGGQC